ncbi:MAG: succinate dehydrogenase/fumarate reductase iron-sulfur subunit [Flavobacteriales bacterium]|jgi:succinate dehydrogenase / fumarate reductase iron-sulfur subunit|nr:succinate dehydrogenase/fumarate reductase iron-sulfur subunit [Flavobacteriales bacterium]NCG29124.1 succinate dehydrogenase/fumarate reductase iron-sulfur subunit [Bacteroidota bacterium]MBT3964065.1 succinate dehydrogenase/fumarate reductase iron-sulfur subunit [Flavobacteriales bacterium]MBT4704419.1 succinate dehydrogenase/fumarate reductase iron-sulfur subunit [Flavobacteriales bacterium]MBT4929470.1 succinate dehydrogenase/fumarate reductase iron-sulfur subunit [Flavobacteriales bacte
MAKRNFQIYRGTKESGELAYYETDVSEGMVVLDVIHKIQAEQANDLALRWNCKAGKCGSCSVEINGKPKLSCMTRMNEYADDETITVTPMKTFPLIRDLVTDVSWNYEQNKKIKPVKLAKESKTAKGYVMYQKDVDRVQEFRKCIECYLCQNVCHVLRDHGQEENFVGPRFMIRVASLEMHPLDVEDRLPELKNEFGSGMCNITRCCTDVCPEHINITDNGIIPMKERVVDRFYDPVTIIGRKIFGPKKKKLPPIDLD